MTHWAKCDCDSCLNGGRAEEPIIAEASAVEGHDLESWLAFGLQMGWFDEAQANRVRARVVARAA
jgi:hypothetical protein